MEWIASFDEIDAGQSLDSSSFEIIDTFLAMLKVNQNTALKNNPSLLISASLEGN